MAGIKAFGTKWSFSTDGGTTFTDVADVTSVDVLNVKADTTDVSSHDSVEEWKEFIGGFKDGGSLSMAINYDPAVHGTIIDNIGGSPIQHKITLPDTAATVIAFSAIITGFQGKAPYDGALTATVMIQVSGKPTFTP